MLRSFVVSIFTRILLQYKSELKLSDFFYLITEKMHTTRQKLCIRRRWELKPKQSFYEFCDNYDRQQDFQNKSFLFQCLTGTPGVTASEAFPTRTQSWAIDIFLLWIALQNRRLENKSNYCAWSFVFGLDFVKTKFEVLYSWLNNLKLIQRLHLFDFPPILLQ